MSEDLKVNVSIKKISNGFLVSKGDNCVYYESLIKFFESDLMESVRAIEQYFREHESEGEQFRLTAYSNVFSESVAHKLDPNIKDVDLNDVHWPKYKKGDQSIINAFRCGEWQYLGSADSWLWAALFALTKRDEFNDFIENVGEHHEAFLNSINVPLDQ